MRKRFAIHGLLALALLTTGVAGRTRASAQAPLALNAARVTVSGTSNIHDYSATTTSVRLTAVQLDGAADGDVWARALAPGGLQAFEITIPAATLSSPKEGLDKNMHKALGVAAHPNIVFRLKRFEPRGTTEGAFTATGILTVAGVEREIALDVVAVRAAATLKVTGRVAFLMTEFGVKPPIAMMGMLKTDPKVTVSFETNLALPTKT